MFAMMFDMFKWLAKEWWLWPAIFLFWARMYRPRAPSIPTLYQRGFMGGIISIRGSCKVGC
jgi:hypothetical protein